MYKKITKILLACLVVMLVWPFFPARASNPHFIYRLTQMGSGTRQIGQWEYEITHEKYNFSVNESVFALTRIFNITDINNFQFKYEIRGVNNKDAFSPLYHPNRNWWAEIWYWDEFGPLPSGQYSLQTLIAVDGGEFKHYDTKYFQVNGADNNFTSFFRHNHHYAYVHTQTDTAINYQGHYRYTAVHPHNKFVYGDDIKVLSRLSDIKNIDYFKIRHELHKNGKFIKKIESSERRPRGNYWEYNYTQSDFGELAPGAYEIKIYLSIEGGIWKQLDSKNIFIEKQNFGEYNYNWTQIGTDFDYPFYSYDYSGYPNYVKYPFSSRQYN